MSPAFTTRTPGKCAFFKDPGNEEFLQEGAEIIQVQYSDKIYTAVRYFSETQNDKVRLELRYRYLNLTSFNLTQSSLT